MKEFFIMFDPHSDTQVRWEMEGEFFGLTLKKAVGDLVNAISKKTGENPLKIMTGNPRFVIRVEKIRERT